jgi:transcription-repair coupling factor (superfamily II helicase)
MEALAPVLVDDLRLLVDELPATRPCLVCDPEKVRTRAHDLVATSQEFLEASWADRRRRAGRRRSTSGRRAYRTLVEVRDHTARSAVPWWTVSPFTSDEDLEDDAVVLAARSRPPTAARPSGPSPTCARRSPTAGASC